MQSKMIGKEWSEMPETAKEPWRRQALVEAEEHKNDHPEYKYRPSAPKTKSSKPRHRGVCGAADAAERKQRRRPTSASMGTTGQPLASTPPASTDAARKRKGGKSRGSSGAATKRRCSVGARRGSDAAAHAPAVVFALRPRLRSRSHVRAWRALRRR